MKLSSNKALGKLSILLLLLTFFVVAGIPVRAQQDPHPIVGSWRLNETASLDQMDADVKRHLDTSPQLKAQVLAAYIGRVITFGEDGSYVQQMANGNGFNGVWRIDNNVLIIMRNNVEVCRQRITKLNDGRLDMAMSPASGDTRPLLPQLRFNKN
ncbi:MAG: hypothetical protein AAFZ89_01690 [Bacteroidota bacterium]